MNVMENLKVFLKHRDQIDCIIMEVSSHAIEENRLAFIRFDRIIYTNITPEHLDYHLTFTHYQYSKFKLRFYLKQEGKILLEVTFEKNTGGINREEDPDYVPQYGTVPFTVVEEDGVWLIDSYTYPGNV